MSMFRAGAAAVIAAVFILIAPAVLFGRGGQDQPAPSEQILKERIVQVGSSAFMVENALYLFPEALERVVAVSDGDQGRGLFVADVDPGLSSKTILPRNANTEAIMALRPDAVVMKNFLKGRMGEPLERIGVETVYMDLENPEAWAADIDTLGVLFGNPERARELKGFFSTRTDEVTGALSGLDDSSKPRTLFLNWSVRDGAATVNVPPQSWMQTRMVQMAGGNPVWLEASSGEGWTPVGLEQLAVWDPDVIFVTAYHVSSEAAAAELRADPVWASIRAVREGRVYPFPADYHSWDQPDVRWLLGLKWLASVLHPEYFPGTDMEEEARGFYADMYGMDDRMFDALIKPRLSGIE
jgi:iron complex transport system substrate-binding protein